MTRDQVVGSAMWAAWGDALGFMTELATPEIVKSRTGGTSISGTIAWKRRVGGRSPVTIDLPPGAYSDDTQLRLATSRGIRSDGRFDVEAFSKVELPVFLNYALGAGRGTKAAASGFVRPRVSWCTNFFEVGNQSYVSGGGNGAAMRIQPHVWASPSHNWRSWLPDVIRNTITTHGHVRGIAGAVIHAALLADSMEHREIRPPGDWHFVIDALAGVEAFVSSDEELSSLWLPSWEQESGTSFRSAMREVTDKFQYDMSRLKSNRLHLNDWDEIVSEMGGLNPLSRGAGDTSAILAGILAWLSRDMPDVGLITAANLLGSDTDTLATMAGAILGAVQDALPPGPIQDQEFIGRESNRLAKIASNESNRHFRYPDLLTWSVPRAAIDAVGIIDGRLAIMGLGLLEPDSQEVSSGGRNPMMWRWAMLPFKQSIMIRHRPTPHTLKPEFMPGRPLENRSTSNELGGQVTLFEASKDLERGADALLPKRSSLKDDSDVLDIKEQTIAEAVAKRDVDQVVQLLGELGFPSEILGATLIAFARSESARTITRQFVDLIVNRVQQG